MDADFKDHSSLRQIRVKIFCQYVDAFDIGTVCRLKPEPDIEAAPCKKSKATSIVPIKNRRLEYEKGV